MRGWLNSNPARAKHRHRGKRKRARTGRGPDAGRTIQFKETDAGRTRTGRGRSPFTLTSRPQLVLEESLHCTFDGSGHIQDLEARGASTRSVTAVIVIVNGVVHIGSCTGFCRVFG
eukprot:gene25038-biopygen8983